MRISWECDDGSRFREVAIQQSVLGRWLAKRTKDAVFTSGLQGVVRVIRDQPDQWRILVSREDGKSFTVPAVVTRENFEDDDVESDCTQVLDEFFTGLAQM